MQPISLGLCPRKLKGDEMTQINRDIGVLFVGFFTLFLTGCGSDSSTVGPTAGDSLSTSSIPRGSYPTSMDMPMPGMEMSLNMVPNSGVFPAMAGNRYDHIQENDFKRVMDSPLSTFSIDVDTASYRNVRQFLLEYNQMPRPDGVRTEELVNYFLYNYQGPEPNSDSPFAVNVDASTCPWNNNHRLVRVALKGKQIEFSERPKMNLVLLLDTSGSMKQPNKLPLLKQGMRLLLNQLDETDRIAIIAYAGSPGLILDSTTADQKETIMNALNRLEAGGSTNGGGGIELAYQLAKDHYIENGVNRVILGTDGDFNVGLTGTDQLIDLVQREAKNGVDLTVLGFGMGNYNDAMLEQISGKGNGNYAFIDTYAEARKVLLEQLSGTLITIAKDVKIQIEFNPANVASYRLIGYENRVLNSEDFNDDRKDAGEIGAGHSVTALYEIVPTGEIDQNLPQVDPLKYQTSRERTPEGNTSELLTVKLRYKKPGEQESEKLELNIEKETTPFDRIDPEFQFAAAVANFGMQLRSSPYRGDWTYADIETVAKLSKGVDPHGFRDEFLQMVAVAKSLAFDTTSELIESSPSLPGLGGQLAPLLSQ